MSDTQHPTDEEPHDHRTPLEGEYDPETVEPRWQRHWVDERTYGYDADADTRYAIDTPPPTVSGDLHMGHLYQFTLQDFVARFRRMYGDTVFFPFGYDDNGIASERLTEREQGIHHGEFSRRAFRERCRDVCETYETAFTDDVQSLAVSVDWENTYKTIEPRVQRLSQLSFLDLYEQGREYRQRAPTIWCPDCETAISQVEQEDQPEQTQFHDIAFDRADADGSFVISTTRPELLPACVAVFVHPDDTTNQGLVGGTARVPLFEQEVPILADERVNTDTGSGVVMCCTFGDQTDIEWYQAHDLDLRLAIDESGTMTSLAGGYEGLDTRGAREAIVEDLASVGALRSSEDHHHTVQVHERCETEVEYLVTEQWYVEVLDRTDTYLELGREMNWYPEKMFTRYKHWVEGLEWDWCISRQRDSGIPFPVWYCADCDTTVTADHDQLPVDPIADDPPVETCPACGGDTFQPEEDVLDTWATSSLTPLINAGWDWDGAAGEFDMDRPELYPAELRPQGHDIISFWLFHTLVKCYEHTGEVPFRDVMINGMVLDENHEAMSKSKGNVVRPTDVLERFPVDATRYWAAGTSIGDDFPYKEGDLEAGERLLQKLWNASRLVQRLTPPPEAVEPPEGGLTPIDRWLLAELDETVSSVTDRLLDYEFRKARDELRTFFWSTFCDDYLEIAKQRLDGGPDPSTEYTLVTAHRTFLDLFAPFLPHVTEEITQRCYDLDGSVHTRDWPEPRGYDANLAAGEAAMEVVSALRRYKTERGLALNAGLDAVTVYGHIEGFTDPVADVMHIDTLDTRTDAPEVTVEIADIDLDYATVGPEYGADLERIETAIDDGDFELVDGVLAVADGAFELPEDSFELERRRSYSGAGTMVETDSAVVVVRSEG